MYNITHPCVCHAHTHTHTHTYTHTHTHTHTHTGFLLSNSPGNIQFEKAGFKLTRDMAAVLGGPASPSFREFRGMCVEGYLAARTHARQVMLESCHIYEWVLSHV